MIKDLTSQQLLLEECMSDISERCHSAGWMQDLEYVLWDAILNGPRKYGHHVITQTDIEKLKELSKDANAWIIYDEEEEETAIDLLEWKQKFFNDTQQKSQLKV